MPVIFKIVSPEDRIFIGRTVNYKEKLKVLKYNKTLTGYINLSQSLKFYGFNKHKIDIIEECAETDMRDRHRYWIEYYKSNNYKFIEENGLNCTNGGEGSGSCTEVRKIKISKANKGKKRKEEWKLSISAKINELKFSTFSDEKINSIIKDYETQNITDLKIKYNLTNANVRYLLKKNNIPVHKRYKIKSYESVQIINIITGDLYPSIKNCAINNNIHPSSLRRKLNGQLKNNTNFIFLNKPLVLPKQKYNIKIYRNSKELQMNINDGDLIHIFQKLNNEYRKGNFNENIIDDILNYSARNR